MWQVLCGDEAILRKVFTYLLEVLNLSLPYQEKNKGNKIVRHPTDIPKSVSHCIIFGIKIILCILGYQGYSSFVQCGRDRCSL